MSTTITSANTIQQVQAACLDNCGYAEANDTGMAGRFVTACRALILFRPSKTSHGKGGSVEFDLAQIQIQLNEARTWLANRQEPDVTHPDMTNFRDLPAGGSFPGPWRY